MRTFREAYDAARERRAFANSTEGYGWMDNWCYRCVHDLPARQGRDQDGCPLVLVALSDRTPSEWLDGPRDEQGRYGIADQYHCVEFRDEDDPGPAEPTPVPDPPGQLTLLPREPHERPGRMFADAVTQPAEVAR